jgi:DMSO/TMAO reductase YedYZ heme-binding membrane subunit
MLKLFFWPPIHTVLVKNQNLIKTLFLLTYIGVISLIGAGFIIFSANLDLYISMAKLANKIGTLALYLFLTTLLPGIFQRFNVLPLFRASIVLFRRNLGILMYLLALLHAAYLTTIPMIMSGGLNTSILTSHEMYGVLAVLILFPVWLTSNDIAQNRLGKYWKTVQRLTYIAIFFIFLHVATEAKSALILTLGVIILEISSWIKYWLEKRANKKLTV